MSELPHTKGWEFRIFAYQRLAENMGLVEKSSVTAFLDGYYEKHPLDNSYEGILARRSGLTKYTVIALLDYADQIIFLANYDPTNYYPLPADELLVEVTKRVEINNKDASNSVSVILPNTYMAKYYQRKITPYKQKTPRLVDAV